MLLGDAFKKIKAALELRPKDPLPEFSHRERLNFARIALGAPTLDAPNITLFDAYERGCLFMSAVIENVIEEIQTDLLYQGDKYAKKKKATTTVDTRKIRPNNSGDAGKKYLSKGRRS
jgi:hypothetical protein